MTKALERVRAKACWSPRTARAPALRRDSAPGIGLLQVVLFDLVGQLSPLASGLKERFLQMLLVHLLGEFFGLLCACTIQFGSRYGRSQPLDSRLPHGCLISVARRRFRVQNRPLPQQRKRKPPASLRGRGMSALRHELRARSEHIEPAFAPNSGAVSGSGNGLSDRIARRECRSTRAHRDIRPR